MEFKNGDILSFMDKNEEIKYGLCGMVGRYEDGCLVVNGKHISIESFEHIELVPHLISVSITTYIGDVPFSGEYIIKKKDFDNIVKSFIHFEDTDRYGKSCNDDIYIEISKL